MSCVFNLGDMFELINDGFDESSFPQQALVGLRQGLLFHVGSVLSNQLEVASLDQVFAQLFGHIPSVGDQLAKQGAHEAGDGSAIIDVAGGERHVEQLASIIEDQVQLEAEKPTG